MKILLAGTPEFSVKTFEKIIKDFDVIGLIAQPNKPVGRKQVMMDPPTVKLAKELGIKVFQPNKIIDIFDELKNINFDILITMAYGQIVPLKILELAKRGSYNIHASLLPKYRGAAPIQYAIANGEKESGITFMEMVEKMDAGSILFQEKINIENDNYDQVLEKMSDLSAKNISNWINDIKLGRFKKIPQNEHNVTFAPKISKNDEKLILDTMDNTINKIRSLSSSPGSYIIFDSTLQNGFHSYVNKRIKIFKAQKNPIKNSIHIQCSDGIIYATEYQVEGKRRVIVV